LKLGPEPPPPCKQRIFRRAEDEAEEGEDEGEEAARRAVGAALAPRDAAATSPRAAQKRAGAVRMMVEGGLKVG